MRIFIDESGNFDYKIQDDTSILCGVMIPETLDEKVEKFWLRFEKNCTKEERSGNGEIKGNLLTEKNVNKLFSFISRNLDIRITLIILPHENSAEKFISEHREEQSKRFLRSRDDYMRGPVKAKEINDFMEEKARWARDKKKISNHDYIKVSIMVDLIDISIRKMFIHYMGKKYEKCFKDFSYFSDQSSSKKMKKYITESIAKFIEARSREEPLVTIEGLEYEGHPIKEILGKTFEGKTGYNPHKIFHKGVEFVDSKDYVGIRIADVVASTIFQIINNRKDKNLFNQIRKNCSFFQRNWYAVKIVSFGKEQVKNIEKLKILSFLQKAPNNSFDRVMGKHALKLSKKYLEKDKK